MTARQFLSGFLVCSGLHAGAQAGDNDCVIQFYLAKVNTDGAATTLMDCVTWLNNEATVQLAPGEQVRITRHCPGCVYCPDDQVGLERRIGMGPGHASATDPVLDTLPLSTWTGLDISEPGSYYLRGLAPNYGLAYYPASLRLIIQGVATSVGEAGGNSFHAWAMHGTGALQNSPAGLF